MAQTLPSDKCVASPAGVPDQDEIRAIAASDGRVSRSSCVLRFHTPAGDRVFQDDLREGGGYVRYLYKGTLTPKEFFVVLVQFYEGEAYEVVGPHGVARIAGKPLLSPNSNRFLASSLDLYAGFNPNALEIWNIERGLPSLEISIRSGQWGPGDVVWVDDDSIRFTQVSLDDHDNERRVEGAQLRRVNGVWSFEPARP
jgi:hypothetical protein